MNPIQPVEIDRPFGASGSREEDPMPRKNKPLLDGFYVSLFDDGMTFCFCPDENEDGRVNSLLSGDEESGRLYVTDPQGMDLMFVYEVDEYDEGILINLYTDVKGTLKLYDKYLFYRDSLLKLSSLSMYADEDETVPMGVEKFNCNFGGTDEGWILKDDGSFTYYKNSDSGEDVEEGRYERVRDDFLVMTEDSGDKYIFFIYNKNIVDQGVLVKPRMKCYLMQ